MSYYLNEKLSRAFVGLAPAPWTGWGIYAKQLCMALVSEGLAWPHTPFGAGRTEACGYDWSLLSRQINMASLELFGALPPKEFNQEEYFDYVFHGFGNGLNGANDFHLMVRVGLRLASSKSLNLAMILLIICINLTW